MRCFHNISFSSSSFSSRSSSSPSLKYTEDNNNNHYQRNQRPKSRYYLGFSIAGARFRRYKEPRNLTDQEIPHQEEAVVSLLSDGGCDTPSSPPSRASKSSSASALAMPLPLPLPVPDGDGEQRLLSPKEVGHCKGLEDRDTDKADEATPSLIDVFASRDLRKTKKNVETISCSRGLQQEVIKGDSNQDEFMVHFPISSAPTSQIASPVATPQRLSAADVFPHYIAPASNQFCSAPEMKPLDVAGLPSRTVHDYNASTTDHTPLHSLPNRSPTRSNRSQSGPPSPIHRRLSLEIIDISSLRPENNGHISVHPLPLPPGVGLASPPSSISQVANKPVIANEF